jgi:hypothetical protein
MRINISLCVILGVCMIDSCSTIQQTESGKSFIEGTVYSFGNEPFTKLTIQSSDGTMYLIQCTKEVEQTLNALQGKKVKLACQKIDSSPEGLKLIVTDIQ